MQPSVVILYFSEIVTPLKQTEGFEQQNATMSCRLSRHTTQAYWMKGNDTLEESEKYRMTTDGCMCSLMVVYLNTKKHNMLKQVCKSRTQSQSQDVFILMFQ
jgi:hypothetical protein